jgi:hypothetical protein
LSPTIDLSEKDSAVLSFYRWFASETGSNPNDDDLVIDVSNNDGSTWTNLETVACSDRNWTSKEFYLEDHITLTNQMKFRFIAQDNGVGGSIVEAGVDDFLIMACQEASADTEPPAVTVITPNGGETCEYGSTYEIQWSATDNVGVVSVTILLSTDSGASFPDTIAVGEPDDGSYTWVVPDMDSKTARIKVVAVDPSLNGGDDISDADFTLWGSASGIGEPLAGIPDEIVLSVTGGNPHAAARIVFGLPGASRVTLAIYDVAGRHVTDLVRDHRAAGYHTIDWSGDGRMGSSVSPGMYFIRLDCGEGAKSTKLVITK